MEHFYQNIFYNRSENMTTYLSADYIEHHITPLPYASIPEGWHIDSGGQFYQLDLKMCQISALHFDFQWGKERYIIS